MTVKRPQCIIIAGVNGVGKSTFYSSNEYLFTGTIRINADEILRQQHGDWRKSADILRAMRQELIKIHQAIKEKQAFHMETTLSGNARTLLDIIAEARQQKFEISLYYLAVRSPQTAVERVQIRVKKGGHGVPEQTVLKRYVKTLSNLPKIAKVADRVRIFDNDVSNKLIYSRTNQNIDFNILPLYDWLPQEADIFPDYL